MSAIYRTDTPPGPAGRWLIDRLKQTSEGAQTMDRCRCASFPKTRERRAAVREKGEPTAAQYCLIQASVGIRRHDGLLRQCPMLLIRRRPRCSWFARARGLLESGSPLWRPVCFASRKKKAHPFMQEGRQLFLEVLQFLTHQGSHKHWKQNEVHEHLRGCEFSLTAEWSLW
jgi:hypothetical protein